MKPVIAIVGRPNVGKSTLFNRLTRSRDAIVHDLPGVTRDRHYGEGRQGARAFIAIDTGGFEPRPSGIFVEMARQAEQAMVEADAIVFVVDGRGGLTAADREIAGKLRRLKTPVFVAVNKTEGMQADIAVAEFHELGLGAPALVLINLVPSRVIHHLDHVAIRVPEEPGHFAVPHPGFPLESDAHPGQIS